MKCLLIALATFSFAFAAHAGDACYNTMEKLRKEAAGQVKPILRKHPECQTAFDRGEKAGDKSCPQDVWDQIANKLKSQAGLVDDACSSDACIDQIDACMEIIDMEQIRESGMNGVIQRLHKVDYRYEKKSEMDIQTIEI